MSNMFTVPSFIADIFGMKTPALGLIYYPVTNKGVRRVLPARRRVWKRSVRFQRGDVNGVSGHRAEFQRGQQ